MKSFKKVFSSFVSFTTILWSVGGTLAFPGIASAATLSTGALIKASGPAVYYYAADGKRYVFPNFATYATWYGNDFNGVMELDITDVARIPLGGNVTYRPGVRMLKLQSAPDVFAVAADGTLRAAWNAAPPSPVGILTIRKI